MPKNIRQNHPYPQYATATLANILLNYSHQPKQALKVYQSVSGIDSSLIFLQKALAYQVTGDNQEAIRYFKIYATAEPHARPHAWSETHLPDGVYLHSQKTQRIEYRDPLQSADFRAK